MLRPYSRETEASLWELSRVDAFLATGCWRRHADRYGTIWLYNRSFCLGRAHAGRDVLVRFDPETRHWVVSGDGDRHLMRFMSAQLSRACILELNVSRHRPARKKKPDSETHQ